jgi:hypothetical protein
MNSLNTMNNDTELIKALSQMIVTEDEPLEYRLHYNELGDIFMCSMQQHPTNEKYIVVDRDTYDRYFKYRVIDGKLELINNFSGVKPSLVKGKKDFRVVKNHAALLLEPNEQYADVEYYDRRIS